MPQYNSHQDRIINKIYEIHVKERENTVFKLFEFYFKSEYVREDIIILNEFKGFVNSNLRNELCNLYDFFPLEIYIEKFDETLNDFLEDTIDSNENDFIKECISKQEKILDKSYNHYIKILGEEDINVMKFASRDFLDEYKHTALRKLEFLKEKLELNKNNEILDKIKRISNTYNNPYPKYFNSYGYEIFEKFIQEIIKVNKQSIKPKETILAEASFIVDKLRRNNLMHNGLKQSEIFDFFVCEIGLNLGSATKFKTHYSESKYLGLYNSIISQYI